MTCLKCAGCVIVNHGELYCLNCGARPLEVTLPAPAAARDPNLCRCGKRPNALNRKLCRPCLDKHSKNEQFRLSLAAKLRQSRKRLSHV